MKHNKPQKAQRLGLKTKARQSTRSARKAAHERTRRAKCRGLPEQSLPNYDVAAPAALPLSQPAPDVVASERSLPTTASRESSAAAIRAARPDDRLAEGRGKVERAFTWLEAKAALAEWARRHLRQP